MKKKKKAVILDGNDLGKEIHIYWALNYKLGTLRDANII